MNATAIALLHEYHRRLTHSDVRTPTLDPLASAQLQGELIGLRGALGIALGGRIQGGEADVLAAEKYARWKDGREADDASCTCALCGAEDDD
ncbi:hypothetical protein [Streptomyces sp. Ac-502]|uniref:hypothetical protein n=1 Tax=Streptomyces sp. Ac-502 TaxID=3342801 RepID=UPI003862AC1C